MQDLAKPGSRPEPLLAKMDAAYDFVDVVDDTFYFVTDRGAPRKRLVAVSRARPEEKDWKEVIPEAKGTDVSALRLLAWATGSWRCGRAT